MGTKGPEARIVAKIRQQLTSLGWYVWKNHGSAYSHAGLPDLMAIKPGWPLIAIEVKAEPNKPSAAQLLVIERLKSHGALAIVAYSWSDVEHALQTAQASLSSPSQTQPLSGGALSIGGQAKPVK